MSVSSRWNLLLRIRAIVKKNKHRSWKNLGCKGLAWIKSVCNIKISLSFANFYWRFIQGFNRIAVPLISMLKITRWPNKPVSSRNNGNKSAFSKNDNSKLASGRNNSNGELNRFDVGGNCVEHAKKSEKTSKSRKLSKSKKPKSEKMSKSRNLAKSGKKMSKSGNSTNFGVTEVGPKFLTFDARTAFNCLRLAFTEAPILRHFDSECHIWIETDILGYAIGRVLNQLTSKTNPNGVVTRADWSQWHPVAFFLRKMISTKTWYKIYNSELLAIVEALKTWHHYLEGCKHKMLVLTDHKKLCRLMDIKILSSKQVC